MTVSFRLLPALVCALAFAACQPEAPKEELDGAAPAPAARDDGSLDGGAAGPSEEPADVSALDGKPIDLLPTAESPCTLFSATEIGAFMGKTSAEGRTGAEDCVWEGADGEGFIRVQVIPAARHAPPTGQPGYEAVAGVGENAYLVSIPDGYSGGAIDGTDAVVVSVGGTLNGRNIALDLLRQAVERNR
jgi:hypothetical protein